MKYTDDEIVKALKCCSKDNVKDCDACPYVDIETKTYCVNELIKDTLDLINRQKAEINILIRKHDTLRDEITENDAEIESLKKILHELKMEAEMVYKQRDMLKNQVNLLKRYDKERDIRLHARLTENARAEAIKEFAERLKKAKQYSLERHENIVPVAVIDWIVKELTEKEDNG